MVKQCPVSKKVESWSNGVESRIEPYLTMIRPGSIESNGVNRLKRGQIVGQIE